MIVICYTSSTKNIISSFNESICKMAPFSNSSLQCNTTNPANASSNVAHSFLLSASFPLLSHSFHPRLNRQRGLPPFLPAITTHTLHGLPTPVSLFPPITPPLRSPQSPVVCLPNSHRHNFLLPPGPPTIGSQSFRGWSPLTPNARDSCRSSGP